MTPDELQRLEAVEATIQEFLEWKRSKQSQQISLPVDEASKNTLGDSGVPISYGPGGTATTQSVHVSSAPSNITVPAPMIGSEKMLINGKVREFPYIA